MFKNNSSHDTKKFTNKSNSSLYAKEMKDIFYQQLEV